MASKKMKTDSGPIVTYRFEDRVYQIDPEQKKVYKRFVEIETAKAAAIFSSWRAQGITA